MFQSQMTYQSFNMKENTNKTKTSKPGPERIHISISYGNSSEIEMHKPQLQLQHGTRQMPMCHFFLQGRCNRGSACRFSHHVQPQQLAGVPTHQPTQKAHTKPGKGEFPALCKQSVKPQGVVTSSEYKNMVSVPVPETLPKQPFSKTKGMVVIYRQVKNGKFVWN